MHDQISITKLDHLEAIILRRYQEIYRLVVYVCMALATEGKLKLLFSSLSPPEILLENNTKTMLKTAKFQKKGALYCRE